MKLFNHQGWNRDYSFFLHEDAYLFDIRGSVGRLLRGSKKGHFFLKSKNWIFLRRSRWCNKFKHDFCLRLEKKCCWVRCSRATLTSRSPPGGWTMWPMGWVRKRKKKVRKTTPFIDKSQLKTTRRRVIFFPNPIKVIDLGDFITVSVTKTCGDSTSNNCTYFQNSGYPSTYDSVGSCQLTVNKCDSSVCQLR